MKQSIRNGITFLVLLISFQAQAVYLSPHIGVDWKYWGAPPTNDLPLAFDKTFPKMSSGMSFYLGMRFNGFVGIDVGYDQSITKETSKVFDGQLPFLTQTPEPVGNASTVRVRFKAWYIHTLFYWDVMKDVELLGLLGISTLKPDTHIYYLTAGQRVEITQHTPSKASARIGLGFQYNPLWFVGIRGMVIWDQTKRLNYLGVDPTQTPFDISPYKSATSYHLGFVFNLDKTRPPTKEKPKCPLTDTTCR